MKQSRLLFRLFALVAALACALGIHAQEAYANYTSSNTTLSFYYDDLRSSRPGTTYDLNTGNNNPGWKTDATNVSVTKVIFDPSFADARPTSTYSWFYNMANLESFTGMSFLNTSEVTSMAYMFYKCVNLTSLDVRNFNTSQVTTMFSMFNGCSSLTSLDLSSFNTSQVTIMGSMFNGCNNLQTIYAGNGWSTAAVAASSNMFTGCTSLVGGQGTTYSSSNPRDKTYAHIDGGTSNPGYFSEKGPEAYACYTESNTTLTFYYDTQRSRRQGTTYNLNTDNDVPEWDLDGTQFNVTKVVFDPSFADARPTTTYNWFYYMLNLQSITGMSYLNTSEVTNMGAMFAGCNQLMSIDVSHFNTSKVTSMSGMFNACGVTSLDLSSFNTDNVTTMGGMFSYSEGLTSVDLSSFTTTRVTRTANMFEGCSALTTIYASSSWSLPANNYSWAMFLDCTSLVGGQGTTYDADHVDAEYAHIDGGPSNPGYFTEKGPEAYAVYTQDNTTLTFYYDSQRSNRPGMTYDLNTGNNATDWETDGTNASVTRVVFDPSFAGARPTTTSSWFYEMENLQSITGMSYLNTSEVANMSWMFDGCNQLTSIDVSHFNTSKVTNMWAMFHSCSSLTSLDLSGFNTSQVTDMSYMFWNSSNLRIIYVGNGWSTAAVTNSMNMFLDCTSLVGGQGTTYNANYIDKTYAHIDGGPGNPGYFTAKFAGMRGDVNGDGGVDITDATMLINYLLSGNANGLNMDNANCDQNGVVDISDATTLINFLLNGLWP